MRTYVDPGVKRQRERSHGCLVAQIRADVLALVRARPGVTGNEMRAELVGTNQLIDEARRGLLGAGEIRKQGRGYVVV